MAKAPKPRIVNRRYQARLERERQQRRLLIYGSIGVAVLVLGLLLYGLLDQLVLQQNRTIATVGNDRITVADFQARVRFARQQSLQQLAELQQMAAMFGDQGDAFFGGQMQQIIAQLSDAESFGDQVLTQMIDELVIRQAAAEMGITVTEAEIDKAMRETFGFYPDGTPTPEPEITLAPTSTLSALQMTLVPPTATPTITPTSKVPPTEVPGESEEAATPTATEDPNATPEPTVTPFPTPTPLTEEGYQEQLSTFLASLEGIKFKEQDLRELLRTQLLWEKVYDAVTADVEAEQEQVWARHILVPDETLVNVVLERLNEGEDFASLAAEMSTDTVSGQRGGDLGWFSRGMMVAPFEEKAYSMEIGEIGTVQSANGWHVIQVLGKEVRQLNPTQLETAQITAFNDWLETARAERTIERSDSWTNYVPTDPSLPVDFGR